MEYSQTTRKSDHPIDPIYTARWSPRSFSNQSVEDDKLNRIFEAARWAPSASNLQPWHFIIAKTEEDRGRFYSFIHDMNLTWCKQAPVLVVVASKKTRNKAGAPNKTHAFDTGTAWGYLSLEAYRQGLVTHGMGGFDREKAKEVLEIPELYDVQAVIAVGYYEKQYEETISDREPITSFVSEGYFNN